MDILIIFIVKLLDPISLVVAAIVVAFSKSPWIIPIAAVASAVVIETWLYSSNPVMQWGQLIHIGLIGGIMHATIAYFAFKGYRKRKAEKAKKTLET